MLWWNGECFKYLSLSIAILLGSSTHENSRAEPIVSEGIVSLVDQILTAPLSDGCLQVFKSVTSSTDGSYALSDANTAASHVLAKYNLGSDATFCAGQVAKIATDASRVTQIFLQFENGDRLNVPAGKISADATGTRLLIHLSDDWLDFNRAGQSALLIINSLSSAGGDSILGSPDLASSDVSFGSPMALVWIPPISTNVNNAADGEPMAMGAVACAMIKAENSADVNNFGILVLAFFLVSLVGLRNSKVSHE